MFKCVCVREKQRRRKGEGASEEESVFFQEKKGEMCQEQILILSCSSPTCPPLSLSLSPSHRLCLSASHSTPSLPPSCLFDLFSLQILQLFYSLPCQCCFFLCVCVCVCVRVCVCVCKPSCCLSLSLSDVQQLLEGSFSLPLKHTHTHTCTFSLILCTSFNLFS